MKICQINCIYGLGSTGKITRDIHLSLLKRGYESIVIAPLKNQFTHSDPGVFVISNKYLAYSSALLRRGLGMQYDWAHIQTWRILKIIKREKPDIVHLQCINGNNINIYILLRYLAKNRIKTLYTLHAEFPYTGGCGNSLDCERWKTGCGNCPNLKFTDSFFIDGTHRTWKKQRRCYNLYDNKFLHFTAVSPWLLSRVEEVSQLLAFSKAVVMNGVDTKVFHYGKTNLGWHKKAGLSDKDILLLYVTASFYPHQDNLKGGRFILDLAKRFKDKPIKILIAANYGDDKELPDNIIYIGRTKTQQELADLYREANVTILTSSNETFGMPVAESLCCGTPVVGFKAGGPESIALPEYSEFVEFADTDALSQAIIRWSIKSPNKEHIAASAKKIYDKEIMTEEYIRQYKELYSCI